MTYIDAIADEIRTAVGGEAVSDHDPATLFLIYAVLLLAKGEAVTREDVHNAWVAWMAERGETHASMVPFSALSPDTQDEDSPFVAAIHRVAHRRSASSP